VLGVAALLLAPGLMAQVDPNAGAGGGMNANGPFPATAQGAQGAGPGAGAPGATPSTGMQTGQAASMRDSLGAPGEVGQQLLDKQFVRTAAEDGLVDVKLATLAEQKGGPEVKTLAQTLVDDHTAMNKDLATVADSLGVMLPKKLNKDDQAEYDKLSGLSGKDFDTEYLSYIVKAHWQKLHAFYMEASVAADPGLQSEVVKSMQTMHQHLGLIAKTATAEGITLPPRPPRPAAPTTTAAKK
jgi:putative membrane protein